MAYLKFAALLLLILSTTTALAQTPRVVPQEPQADGSLVHEVKFGDTFNGIISAYIGYGITIEQILEYNDWRFPPDFITVGQQVIILPPGSVDTSTGQVNAAPPPPSDTAEPAVSSAAAPLPTLTAAEIAALPVIETVAPFLPQQ